MLVHRPLARSEKRRRSLGALTAMLLVTAASPLGCGKGSPAKDPKATSVGEAAGTRGDEDPTSGTAESTAETEATAEARRKETAAHRVVFSDRTSHGYLLLTQGPIKPEFPTRENLVALVRTTFPNNTQNSEVSRLIQLIETEPHATDVQQLDEDDPGSVAALNDRKADLLGLHIEVLKVDDDLITPAARNDDILLRELSPLERATLADRGWAILLRADYRNQHGVRGLRLLQTLVRIVAQSNEALIHDADTLETLGPEAFSRRRLKASLGNVADQIAIVPFPDPRHPERLRLITRGMRRFGSVDLELGGLIADPWLLQRGTDFLVGLAILMVREGEYDAAGYAVQLPETVTVHWSDVSQGYAGQAVKPPRCADCPEEVLIHLVERPREDHDPHQHVVARVVAPRTTSDAADYDHPSWVEGALGQMFGKAAPG